MAKWLGISPQAVLEMDEGVAEDVLMYMVAENSWMRRQRPMGRD